MINPNVSTAKNFSSYLIRFLGIALGAFLAAFSIEVFLIPNNLIDGGVVGLSMILGKVFGKELIPAFLFVLNLPFIYLAYRSIGKSFLINMALANALFILSMVLLEHFFPSWVFTEGDKLEVVVIGGALLGLGFGIIIRLGACLDGTEILGIILCQKKGYTVGQVVLFCNFFVFATAGFVFQDWHPPILSLITYVVVIKIMDTVIVGLDETKSVLIISSKSKEISKAIVHELGLGLTVMYGRGGYSGEEREILYVIAERLQLSELKEIVHQADPSAFVAIENLHEVASGYQPKEPHSNNMLSMKTPEKLS